MSDSDNTNASLPADETSNHEANETSDKTASANEAPAQQQEEQEQKATSTEATNSNESSNENDNNKVEATSALKENNSNENDNNEASSQQQAENAHESTSTTQETVPPSTEEANSNEEVSQQQENTSTAAPSSTVVGHADDSTSSNEQQQPVEEQLEEVQISSTTNENNEQAAQMAQSHQQVQQQHVVQQQQKQAVLQEVTSTSSHTSSNDANASSSASEQKPLPPMTLSVAIAAKYNMIPYSELSFGELIHQGTFCDVFRGVWRQKFSVAIKRYKFGVNETELNAFTRKVFAASKIDHPGLVKVYGLSINLDSLALFFNQEQQASSGSNNSLHVLHLVMEYASNGPLDVALKDHKVPTSWHWKWNSALQLANALHCLHSNKIIRDIKSSNIMLDEQYRVKLCTVGKVYSTNANIYTPPELETEWNEKCDIYSLGVVFYEMLATHAQITGSSLLNANEAFAAISREDLLRGIRPDLPTGFLSGDVLFIKLISKMWHQYTKLRPTAAELVQLITSYRPANEFDIFTCSVEALEKHLNIPLSYLNNSNSSSLAPVAYNSSSNSSSSSFFSSLASSFSAPPPPAAAPIVPPAFASTSQLSSSAVNSHNNSLFGNSLQNMSNVSSSMMNSLWSYLQPPSNEIQAKLLVGYLLGMCQISQHHVHAVRKLIEDNSISNYAMGVLCASICYDSGFLVDKDTQFAQQLLDIALHNNHVDLSSWLIGFDQVFPRTKLSSLLRDSGHFIHAYLTCYCHYSLLNGSAAAENNSSVEATSVQEQQHVPKDNVNAFQYLMSFFTLSQAKYLFKLLKATEALEIQPIPIIIEPIESVEALVSTVFDSADAQFKLFMILLLRVIVIEEAKRVNIMSHLVKNCLSNSTHYFSLLVAHYCNSTGFLLNGTVDLQMANSLYYKREMCKPSAANIQFLKNCALFYEHHLLQYFLGAALVSGVHSIDKEQSQYDGFMSLQSSALQGNALAQCLLGNCYQNGVGSKQRNFDKAVKCYQLSASQNYVNAQVYLAQCVEAGAGIAKNEKDAVQMYKQAAEQGKSSKAQLHYARCLENGIGGLVKNVHEAIKWYTLAAQYEAFAKARVKVLVQQLEQQLKK